MTVPKTHQDRLAAYIRFFETLTPQSVDDLEKLAREDFSFEDPFNHLTNRRDAVRLFRRMFDDVDDPSFKITGSFWNEDGTTAPVDGDAFYLKVGERIGNATIVEIRRDAVILDVQEFDAIERRTMNFISRRQGGTP